MSGPSGNDPLHPPELVQRAQEYHFRDSLPPEEYEALMEIGGDIVTPLGYDDQCFILGSYDTREKQRLEYLKSQVNSWPGKNSRAYLMEDFADDLHPMVQFRIIADYSDEIIAICEHDQGGFQLELGMLLALTEYQDRSHILKRSYPDDVEHEKYNWMLNAGAFDLFEYQGRLHEWQDTSELKAEIGVLLTEILG